MLMPPRALGRMGLGGTGYVNDEYFTRPYSAESLRWRIEAMLIRVENAPAEADADIGPIIAADMSRLDALKDEAIDESKRGKLIIVFNPKGGVGKTTISINLGAALRLRKSQRVLLVDCDTITGHIASSLGLTHPRTLASAWREGGPTGTRESLAQVAASHPSGVGVLVMAESPLHTEVLEPRRVAEAVARSRESYDFVILDMHPDYGPLNQALFELADRILVPVTPDVPCIRAAVQFRDVAEELGIRHRLAMVINRANSGVTPADVERVVAIPTLARIRSAGMLFVRAADEGKSAVESFPTAKVVGDIGRLADRLLAAGGEPRHRRLSFPSPGRIAASVRGLFHRRTAQV
jgi:pilus assembly protein CpaE